MTQIWCLRQFEIHRKPLRASENKSGQFIEGKWQISSKRPDKRPVVQESTWGSQKKQRVPEKLIINTSYLSLSDGQGRVCTQSPAEARGHEGGQEKCGLFRVTF